MDVKSWVIVLLIVLASSVYVVISQKSKIEQFQQPDFVSDEYMLRIIEKSPFFKRMNDRDLQARGTFSSSSYMKSYASSLRPFTSDEKAELGELVDLVDQRLGMGAKRIKAIPWKFAKVTRDIERGWPHTLGDVIVLSPEFFKSTDEYSKAETLLHEKFHVYQREFPELTEKLVVNSWNYMRVTELPSAIDKMQRNNPDIEGNYSLYGYVVLQVYNNPRPSTIAASQPMKYNASAKDPITTLSSDLSFLPFPTYIHQLEHPYEIMAVMGAHLLMSGNPTHETETRFLSWSYEYL